MKKLAGLLLLSIAFTGSLFAEKVIYVHGMSLTESNEACQGQATCGYWKNPVTGDHVFVGYDGRRNPFESIASAGSVRLLQMLNQYCRNDQGQSCRLVVDSMGGFTAAGTIAMYNRDRIYNILYSTHFVSAEGGSDIASLGDTAIAILEFVFNLGNNQAAQGLIESRDAIDALVVSNARSLFDHNRTNGTLIYHVAAKGSIFIAEPFLPGKDDSLVAFHSSCGYRVAGGFSKCMGEKIRTCALCFWQKPTNITPWDGHRMYPGAPIEGVSTTHAPTHNDFPQFYARP